MDAENLAVKTTLKHSPGKEYVVNVLVCVVAGVTSAMLNFGFYFGDSIRDEAQARGASEFIASMPVWFLGICMCVVPGIAYAS